MKWDLGMREEVLLSCGTLSGLFDQDFQRRTRSENLDTDWCTKRKNVERFTRHSTPAAFPRDFCPECIPKRYSKNVKIKDQNHYWINMVPNWIYLWVHLELQMKISTRARCLKITEKVSFNIASEASYVIILSGQKLMKNVKNGAFWRVFENLTLTAKQIG